MRVGREPHAPSPVGVFAASGVEISQTQTWYRLSMNYIATGESAVRVRGNQHSFAPQGALSRYRYLNGQGPLSRSPSVGSLGTKLSTLHHYQDDFADDHAWDSSILCGVLPTFSYSPTREWFCSYMLRERLTLPTSSALWRGCATKFQHPCLRQIRDLAQMPGTL